IRVDQPLQSLSIGSQIINSTGGILKTGAGTLTLSSGSNNFTGDITIAGGTLVSGNSNSMVNNTIIFSPGSGGEFRNANQSFTVMNGFVGDSTATITSLGAGGGNNAGFNVTLLPGVVNVFGGLYSATLPTSTTGA